MDAATVRESMKPEADLDLAQRHRYGDETAFEEIYDRFGGMVFNLALRLSGEPEEAADLSQETFLKIHRHLSGFRGRSSLKTWVYRVAVNCCRSRYKKQSAWRSRLLPESEEKLERLPDRRRSPEERAIARGAVGRIAQALAELPTIYREAVLLRDIEGLTYEEMSQVLGLRLGTVRSRIARGRDKLRVLLEVSE
jgi:RNA polymerase sigma-70 factor (ECF subfamily)